MTRLGLLIAYLCVASPAFAYIDPNAGGFIFQLAAPLLAFGATALMVLRKKFVLLRAALCTALRKAAGSISQKNR
jgi:hypothetical protein